MGGVLGKKMPLLLWNTMVCFCDIVESRTANQCTTDETGCHKHSFCCLSSSLFCNFEVEADNPMSVARKFPSVGVLMEVIVFEEGSRCSSSSSSSSSLSSSLFSVGSVKICSGANHDPPLFVAVLYVVDRNETAS
ncbi:hypothetical protein QR685DRAFT_202003 [Neurospora intermedia]|uniref:Secreted protein n=1 Tax=Neurospora intermedia TaxID=5142 RepID=A0ABR3DFE1_NEUIN